MPRLTVEWSTSDPQLAAILNMIAEFPEHSAERLELEATLHAAEAARLMREAGEKRVAAMERRTWRGSNQTKETQR
jgi:hypothetical protein